MMNHREIGKRESHERPISMLRRLYHICTPFALASIDENCCCVRHLSLLHFLLFLEERIQKMGKAFSV